ncbi:MAG TPA: MMPL family transporter [Solirubrobacterales bacterium]|nr:MMPL family transporter [Solirubrobacterales bacterium]
MFARVAAWAVRHARPVLAISIAIAVAAGIGAMSLSTDAAPSTLIDSDAPSYRATQQVREAFGEEPVVVLVEGDLQQLVLTPNLGRLLRLEGCLSGKVPAGVQPIPGACAELAKLNPVESVNGPATFLNEAVIQIDRQLSHLVKTVPRDQLRQFLLEVAARYGITSAPSLNNPEFLAAVVFDLRRSRGTPKARLSYLFPNRRTAQIIVRLRPDLSAAQQRRAIELIRDAVADPTPRQACRFKGRPEPCFALHGGRYVVSGVPVVVNGVAAALQNALAILLAAALVVMALTLIAVFRARLRLLPLAIALGAAALSFGLLRLVGGSLTMASIAVLPILIGLVVDYAIQLQARVEEAAQEGLGSLDAAQAAARRGGPAIATACLATAAGFAVLQLSPVPMVRGFGVLLIAGILLGFALALIVVPAALSLRSPTGRGGRPFPPLGQRLLDLALRHPQRVLAVGGLLAVAGWGVGTQLSTVTDIRELAPQNAREVRDLNELQDATGVSGTLDVSVHAPDLTDPATLRWMATFKRRVLRTGGFSGPEPSCLSAEICPGPALSDFVASGSGALKRGQIRDAFEELPAYDLEQVATLDPKTGQPGGLTLLSFGIRAQSLEAQQRLIERVRGEIGDPGSPGGPPPGVAVELAGLPVIAAAAASDLSASRYWLTLAGLAAVLLVLAAVYRSPRRALLPLVPVLFATGWSALVLWVSGVPLNPMSAALGALTVAIATEFSVILTARFDEERSGGRSLAEALRRSYSRTGAAVLASAITAIAGFAVLIVSDVGMLRDFGLVTVLDLGVALLGVMIVLPAALAWEEARR